MGFEQSFSGGFAQRSEKRHGMQSVEFFEKAVLHECDGKADGYLKYGEAKKWVKEHQPQKDLRKPETLDSQTISDLKMEISQRLADCDIDEVLRFYTAVGSSLDVHHGVDGFFSLGKHDVTIDLTLNLNKAKVDADVLIVGDEEDGVTDEILMIAAKEITQKFKEKMGL